MRDPTKRFSDRVENYRKYRPGYPDELYDYLRRNAGLKRGDEIADLGSGTGLLTRVFLANSHKVFAIEPNAEMRLAAEEDLGLNQNFVSLDGRAEAIPLGDSSVDFVVAGQAFHWFDSEATRGEVGRILRVACQAALIWNTRAAAASPFQTGYENLLLKFGTDFKTVDHRRNLSNEKLASFFAPNSMQHASFANEQVFDLEGLKGRLLSSSYAPKPEEAYYKPILDGLGELFDRFQQNGSVRFVYSTDVYHARIGI